jgi:3-phosphoshikimate 1-carboxyvinyltransferase
MNSLKISGIDGFNEDWQTTVPLSKSISNRLLIMQFLSVRNVFSDKLSDASDTIELAISLNSIRKLEGKGGYIYSGEGGTVLRFLLALLSITKGEWLLDCSGNMRKRPVKPLIEALVNAGAEIMQHKKDVFPLKINGKILNPKKINIDNSISSQFLTALLLVAPCFKTDTLIKPCSGNVSAPYIEITVEMMRNAGIVIETTDVGYFVKKGRYTLPLSYKIEGDWSAAAFWFALAATRRKGFGSTGILSLPSLQGDSFCAELFKKLGVNYTFKNRRVILDTSGEKVDSIQFDFSNYPDLALPFIIACAVNKTYGYFTGLNSLEYKESKRLSALCTAFDVCGIDYNSDKTSYLRIFPSEIAETLNLNTYNDHRLAMSFALLAAAGKTVVINEPGCVAKSYPAFWEQLSGAGFTLTKLG